MVTTLLLAGLAVLAPWSDECDHEAPREASLSARGVRLVRIRAVSGSLAVEGRSGLSEVRARGTACASEPDTLAEIRLTATREGDTVLVEASMPAEGSWTGGARRLEFTVDLPAGTGVEVEDGSGPVEIREVGPLRVKDGSGSILVEGVAGDARIDDGSGSIDVRRVSGTVTVGDGSGAISLVDVGGVEIEEDGSGSIEIRQVRGNVLVRRDGSGAIVARDVAGDLVVERDGSGGVTHAGVRGQVRVPRHE